MDRRIEKTRQALKNAYFEILKEKKAERSPSPRSRAGQT